ncbi:DNA repair protein RadC [Polyangium sp. y55x31]|uniref:RadC family protein n=1 Tax=Polyangium sp. y55x31 TaxID=3042688 RepID=UPI0024830BAC|nr:DNA repair protein RadC [Polyangium sp. y55x31]MDI1484003.1 DNA repair protein RadC [Polyangium sp. y55x31]
MLELATRSDPLLETMPLGPRGPRERALEEGILMLSDADLLAIVLGTGLVGCPVFRLANELLDRVGGLEGLGRLGPSAIAEIPGVGTAKALRLLAGLEIGRRSLMRSIRPRPEVCNSAAVASWFTSRLAWREYEELWVISLDGRNGLRSARRVAQGGVHGLGITSRDVLRVALQDTAAAMILVHNHPSGDPKPSDADVAMTRKVAEASVVVGVPLLDHVIVSSTGNYCSMLDLGILPFE